MASFDILSASSRAYKTGWSARAYLVRLAAVPFFLKIFCFTLAGVYAGGPDGNQLRFMLIMLPALFAEGWMLSHFARYVVLGQTWPFRASGDFDADMAILAVRARGVLSGMIVFVLINMALGALMTVTATYFMPYIPADASSTVPQVPAGVAVASLAMLVLMVWGFRLFWLYIPFSLNIDIKTYISSVRGWNTSFYMMGVWVLCFVPFLFLLRLFGALISAPIGAALGESAGSFVMIILIVLTDTAKGLITTAGIAYGLQEIFSKAKP